MFRLTARMEFRPLVEMTPEHLEPQVEMELNEERSSSLDYDAVTPSGGATSKILQKCGRVRSAMHDSFCKRGYYCGSKRSVPGKWRPSQNSF